MTAQDFIEKWGPGGANFAMTEKAGAQQHFLELCTLLGVDSPNDAEHYTFEKGTLKLGEARGFADVFKRGAFAWENKGPNADLKGALKQLKMYASALDNPPLLVVSDRLVIEVHTQFTGTPTEVHRFTLKDLTDPARVSVLRKVWLQPEAFKPKRTSRDITEAAAKAFADVANRMRDERKESPERVAHFLTQCVFCFFAEDVGLLPQKLFDRLVAKQLMPEKLHGAMVNLFHTMRDGGLFGTDDIPWFNGGLFKLIDVPMLTPMDIAALRTAAQENWSAIDVSIFGTLFERGLDPAKRSQLGAHYTDPETIMRIVNPVVLRPLEAEWAIARAEIEKEIKKSKKHADAAWGKAANRFNAWLERLKAYRVLDPACGSGNFLYLALRTLKDFELGTHVEAEMLGLLRPAELVTSPANVLGIELNEYAAELARVTVWIGEIQWNIVHGWEQKKNPVLEPLDHIENRDALLTFSSESAPQVLNAENAKEAEWPKADAIVGNPPFLGGSKKRRELGDDYFEALNAIYAPQVPGGADLVCYWFYKANESMQHNLVRTAGLVATQSIRTGANRQVIDKIVQSSRIYDAWSDEEWVNDGAGVRVSLVSFGNIDDSLLNGVRVGLIGANLGNASIFDITKSQFLLENTETAFEGTKKYGPFEIEGALAREWLISPNPIDRSNAEVVKPWRNGNDLTKRESDTWIIDFGCETSEQDAAFFAKPFWYISRVDFPKRNGAWWLHERPRPALRIAISRINRFIATPRVSKHRFFVFVETSVLPDSRLNVIARSDNTNLGILSSRQHILWVKAAGSIHGDGADGGRSTYSSQSCFETYPFPAGLTPRDTAHQRTEALPDGALIPAEISSEKLKHCAAGIASAARHLNELRERWLNPTEWTVRVPEVIPLGMETSPYPDRILPKPNLDEKSLAELKKRTLTNLYNARPAWLDNAHKALDAAVATAYGWADYTSAMTDDEILSRLLALNLARAKAQ
jgi:N-6 DNA Methylase